MACCAHVQLSANLSQQHNASGCLSACAVSVAPSSSGGNVDCHSSSNTAHTNAHTNHNNVSHANASLVVTDPELDGPVPIGVDLELQEEIMKDMHKKEKKYRVYNGEVSHTRTCSATQHTQRGDPFMRASYKRRIGGR